MSKPPADALLHGLAQGREQAFAALYDLYGTLLYRVAYALLASRHEAEDAVQDVFVGLVRARASLPHVQNLRSYLLGALRHAAAQRAKRLLRAGPLTTDVPGPLPTVVCLDQAERLERALASLPAEQRQIVILKVQAELTFAEIAELLGVNANTAASRYRYALEKLRGLLEEGT